MKTKFKLLTGLTTLASLSSVAIALTSCSNNTREIVESLAYKDLIDMSFKYSDNGDGIITITPKDINNYVPDIKLVQIGDNALTKKQDYIYDSDTNTITIYKAALDKYAGKIYVFPSDVTFRPVVHDYKQKQYEPTIVQKSGIECNLDQFNNTYLADAYNNYQVFEQDWFNNQNSRLQYWESLDEYTSKIEYLKINQNISNETTTYTLDVAIHNSITGKSTVSELGQTSGQWFFYGQNIELIPITSGTGNWQIIPNTPKKGKWAMHMVVSGFNQTESTYDSINNESEDDDITQFFLDYFSFGSKAQAIGLNNYLSYYFSNIDTVTTTHNVSKETVTNYELEVPSTITNKDKTLTCKIVPTDKTSLYAPKLVITDLNDVTLYTWVSEQPVKGDYAYTFDLSNRPITKDVKVSLTLNKFVPLDYSSISSFSGWTKTDDCPEYVVINNNVLKADFMIKCDDSLKDNLYMIDWQINDQTDTKIYPGESETVTVTKDPGQTESNVMSVSYGLDQSKIESYTQFKLVINSITLEPHAKVTYSSLPSGWAWGSNCSDYIYKNTSTGWIMKDFKLAVGDEDFEEWYKVTITVKNADKTISTTTIDKESMAYHTQSIELSGEFDNKDITITAEVEKQITYAITRDTPPKKWYWLTTRPSRIYNKDGKWEITRDLYMTLSSGSGEYYDNAYDVTFIIKNDKQEVVAQKTYTKEAESGFLGGIEISGDWGEKGPGNLNVSLKITKK